MNVLTVVAVLIVAASMIYGYSRGFVRVAFSLASMLVLILLVSWATPHVSGFLKEHTQFYPRLQQASTERIREGAWLGPNPAEMEKEQVVENAGFPTVLQRRFMSTMGNALEGSGFYEGAGSFLADWIIGIIAFFLVLIIAKILLQVVVRVLDIFTKIPIIRGINRFFGLFAGFVFGCVVVTLLMFLVVAFAPSRLGQEILVDVKSSPILNFFYNYNGISVLMNGGVAHGVFEKVLEEIQVAVHSFDFLRFLRGSL